MVQRESRPSKIGPINLDTKQTGAPSAANPHAGCDVAGAGNGFTVWLMRHSQRKRGETDRPDLRNTAPALDPTKLIERVFVWSKLDGPMRQVKLRGLARVDWFYRMTISAYNLVRMRRLIPIEALAC